jgi:hypothetical protein
MLPVAFDMLLMFFSTNESKGISALEQQHVHRGVVVAVCGF